jgi:hypothetical protein
MPTPPDDVLLNKASIIEQRWISMCFAGWSRPVIKIGCCWEQPLGLHSALRKQFR